MDRQFVIHPCFRNALQSTSAFDLAPFAVSAAADIRRIRMMFLQEMYREHTPQSLIAERGKRFTRVRSYLVDRIRGARELVGKERMPDEICDEIKINLDNIRDELTVVDEAGDEIMEMEALIRAERHLTKMRVRLTEGQLVSEKSHLIYGLRQLGDEMRGYREQGIIREYRA